MSVTRFFQLVNLTTCPSGSYIVVVILKVGEVGLLGLVLVEAKCCSCSRLDRVLRYISAGFPISLVDFVRFL